jgi:(2Fe-2S) ferredoxin
MQSAPYRPKVHLFVCTNDRDPASLLGPGCGAAGLQVFQALKRCVADDGAYASIWVTQTGCMGICPKKGATVALYASAAGAPASRILTEVEPDDAARIYADARSTPPHGGTLDGTG